MGGAQHTASIVLFVSFLLLRGNKVCAKRQESELNSNRIAARRQRNKLTGQFFSFACPRACVYTCMTPTHIMRISEGQFFSFRSVEESRRGKELFDKHGAMLHRATYTRAREACVYVMCMWIMRISEGQFQALRFVKESRRGKNYITRSMVQCCIVQHTYAHVYVTRMGYHAHL